jgi:hypothetical protein
MSETTCIASVLGYINIDKSPPDQAKLGVARIFPGPQIEARQLILTLHLYKYRPSPVFWATPAKLTPSLSPMAQQPAEPEKTYIAMKTTSYVNSE